MTESQVLQSTRALNALENSHPGKIPKSILSAVQPENESSTIEADESSQSSSLSPNVKNAKGI
jgi:hypothetical protein